MGVAGAGKSTVGARLAAALGWPFLDADALHPSPNVEKMRRGIPLSDADRDPWLTHVRQRIEDYVRARQSAVVACSALRREYRERLRVDPAVRFVFLKGDSALLLDRLNRRVAHFLKAPLLASQLASLEEPIDAITIDAALPVDEIVQRIRGALDIDR
jgi:gluconokinase